MRRVGEPDPHARRCPSARIGIAGGGSGRARNDARGAFRPLNFRQTAGRDKEKISAGSPIKHSPVAALCETRPGFRLVPVFRRSFGAGAENSELTGPRSPVAAALEKYAL